MARYIDLDELLTNIDKRNGRLPLWLDEILMEDCKVADVVEVVRCKDCKWYKESKLLEPNKFCFRLKDRNGDPIGYNFSSNEFCSCGERKELENG